MAALGLALPVRTLRARWQGSLWTRLDDRLPEELVHTILVKFLNLRILPRIPLDFPVVRRRGREVEEVRSILEGAFSQRELVWLCHSGYLSRRRVTDPPSTSPLIWRSQIRVVATLFWLFPQRSDLIRLVECGFGGASLFLPRRATRTEVDALGNLSTDREDSSPFSRGGSFLTSG